MKPHFLAASLFLAAISGGAARADDFYVTCQGNNTIVRISGGTTTKIYASNALFYQIAQDRSSDLFVPEPGKNQIVEFPAEYGAAGDKPVIFAGNLNAPHSIAFDSKGNLYEIEGNGDINKFTFANGRLSNKPVLFANGLGLVGPSEPMDMAFDAQDNLYLTILIGGILEFPHTAKGLSPVPQTFSSISRAREMAFDSSGNLFVVDHLAGEIGVYEFHHRAGGLSHAPQTFAIGNGLDGPEGVAFDSEGNLYVTNWGYNAGTNVLEYPRTNAGLAHQPVVFAKNLSAPNYILPVKGGMIAMVRR